MRKECLEILNRVGTPVKDQLKRFLPHQKPSGRGFLPPIIENGIVIRIPKAARGNCAEGASKSGMTLKITPPPSGHFSLRENNFGGVEVIHYPDPISERCSKRPRGPIRKNWSEK